MSESTLRHATRCATQKHTRTSKSNEQDPHSEALSNVLSHAGTKQNMYTCKCYIPMQSHATTCLFSNGVQLYGWTTTKRHRRRCPVETKNPVGKNKHYRQQKGSSSTRPLQCENTATHTRLLNSHVSKWQLLLTNRKAYAPHQRAKAQSGLICQNAGAQKPNGTQHNTTQRRTGLRNRNTTQLQITNGERGSATAVTLLAMLHSLGTMGSLHM